MTNNSFRKNVINWLKDNVSEHRLQHILGVEKTCFDLAYLHQLDTTKAAKAGLLHDLAKFFPPEKLLQMATANNIMIDTVCEQHPHLIHADISAVVAQQEFGVKDPEILDAIANHTLGTPGMSKLSCLVFVADAIEPSRGENSELKKLRKLATKNLYQCLYRTSDYSLQYLIENKKVIHPRTVLTRNWALMESK